ncbi:MAG: calcium-binding protein [Kordiimonas sp.]
MTTLHDTNAFVRATSNNIAPTTKSSWVDINKNTNFTFDIDNFNFEDENSDDVLVSVEVVSSRTTSGVLNFNGQPLQDGQVLTPGDIPSLKYIPSSDAIGSNMASITYRVSDGVDWSMNGIVTINIEDKASNTAPTSRNAAVDVQEDVHEYRFTTDDFPFSDDDGVDKLEAVEIVTLNVRTGKFRIDGRDVTEGDVISASMINGGGLYYIPDANVSGNEQVEFEFRVSDGEEYSPVYTYYIDVIDTPEPNIGDNPTRGTSGADSLLGTSGNDTLVGGGGDDFLRGDEGDDNVEGGAGNDRIFAGPTDKGRDYFVGNTGNDTIGGGPGDDFLVGGNVLYGSEGSLSAQDAGADVIFGGSGNDKIWGGGISIWMFSGDNQWPTGASSIETGNDPNKIWAGSGNDTIYGDSGNDTIGGGTGNDKIRSWAGNNLIFGGTGSQGGNDDIRAGDGDDTIYASQGKDEISSGDGNDVIFGGPDNDRIYGGDGDDIIWGGSGYDYLNGGEGSDTFLFASGFGTAEIEDFSDGDKIDLTAIEGLSIADLEAVATFENSTTTITLDTHGILILQKVDETEFQALLSSNQILVSD